MSNKIIAQLKQRIEDRKQDALRALWRDAKDAGATGDVFEMMKWLDARRLSAFAISAFIDDENIFVQRELDRAEQEATA